jgi:predicted nucleic acid-binding protein
VWLALSIQSHVHHRAAAQWLAALSGSQRLCFCRRTQLGLLRLPTTAQLMGDDEVLTQVQAWSIYDDWLSDEGCCISMNRLIWKSRFDALPNFVAQLRRTGRIPI